MYIVAIAWLYVALMMAVTEPSVTGGVLTFTLYGALPLALFLWLVGTPERRRRRARAEAQAEQEQDSGADPPARGPR